MYERLNYANFSSLNFKLKLNQFPKFYLKSHLLSIKFHKTICFTYKLDFPAEQILFTFTDTDFAHYLS